MYNKKRYPSSNCKPCVEVDPTCITPPPVCEGEECDEVFLAKCIKYTGRDIDCLGITTGMSLTEIIDRLEESICEDVPDYDELINCISPLDYMLNEVKMAYENTHNTASAKSFATILGEIMDLGLIIPNCDFCCTECGSFYALANNAKISAIFTATESSPQCGYNIASGFENGYDMLVSMNSNIANLFGTTLGREYSSYNAKTSLIRLALFLQSVDGLTSQDYYDIVEVILTKGFTSFCYNNDSIELVVFGSVQTLIDNFITLLNE